jgi:heme oxygenase
MSGALATGSARSALRGATEAAHLRLHEVPAFQALAEGRLTLGDYTALLRRKLGFHQALETRLADAPSLAAFGIELAERQRAPLLRADLAFLDMPADAPLAPLPRLDTAPEAMGALYVAEGATLGGRHLARGLDGLLPPGQDGRRFLLGHGARHGEMWRGFCAAVERCGATPPGLDGMIRGAAATFAAFEAWFAAADATCAQPRPADAGP